MPATSEKQKKFMDAAAHNPAFAKASGVPVKVAKEFSEASKGMKFGKDSDRSRPDLQKINSPSTRQGKMELFSKGGRMATKKLFGGKESMKEELSEAKAIKSGKITPMQYAKGEKSEGVHGMKKMAKGGSAGNGITTAKMGAVKAGGFKGKGEHAVQSKGLSKGTMVSMKADGKPLGMKKGGMTKKMNYGGKAC
jgi:hypothetical protein